jgi:uncharacterized membrane protein
MPNTPDALFTPLLIIHIAGGAIGLLTGLINIARRKGDRFHRQVGKIFTYNMLANAFSAIGLALLHPNSFLFIVGIFTLYMVGTGNRCLRLKKLRPDDSTAVNQQAPKPIDWILTGGMLIAGLIFVFRGIQLLVAGNTFGIVYTVFGGLGLFFVKTDFTNYRGQAAFKNYWVLVHLQRMTGSYIAATTAFLVVNASYFPEQIPSAVYWLLPTLVLTPLIIVWSRKRAIPSR